jgi:hypothetical protein
MNTLILATVATDYAGGVLWFNSEQTLTMVSAEYTLFFGGFMFAFACGAFSMIMRALKGAGREIDL